MISSITSETDGLDNLVKYAVEEYRRGADEVVGEAVYDGHTPVDSNYAWVGHMSDAHIAEWAVKDSSADPEYPDRAKDIVRQALSQALSDNTPTLGPHAEYIVYTKLLELQ